MIGIEKCEMTMTTTMINRVNTMTPRQNDLVVKNASEFIVHTTQTVWKFKKISAFKIYVKSQAGNSANFCKIQGSKKQILISRKI